MPSKAIFIRSILFLVTFVVLKANPAFSQDDSPGIIASDSSLSDAELLVNYSQTIESDKIRLKGLRTDSIRITPIFQKTSLQFYQIELRLDSIHNTSISPAERALLELEREQLKGTLDFLLDRRRSIYQQIKIVTRKIEKEEELVEFALIGETALVFDITEDNKRKVTSETDSSIIKDVLRLNTDRYNWELIEEERELEILKAKYNIARNKWELAEQLLLLNQDDYTITQTFIQNTTRILDKWEDMYPSLQKQLAQIQVEDTASQFQGVFESRLAEMDSLVSIAENKMIENTVTLKNLDLRIDRLGKIIPGLSDEVANITKRIQKQNRWISYLKSPFSPAHIFSFLINSGPRIIIIIVLLFITWVVGRWLTTFVLKSLKASSSSSIEFHQERTETLSRAIRSALTVIVLLVGFLSILSEFGTDISVLLGGAAVFSLAIAFGAQSLVKDFFSGFMILSENQYRVGNVIKINQVSGVVEDITLRTTILRDLEGVAHFIPHGEITTVSNYSHRWSRVALEIGVAYKENVDHVIEVIMEVAQGMRDDANYANLITDNPEMLGVDAFADSAVIIKVLIRTRPLQQWIVKREFLRRLKNRFDELGIEIPFPHRTIYHRDLYFPENPPSEGAQGEVSSTGQ